VGLNEEQIDKLKIYLEEKPIDKKSTELYNKLMELMKDDELRFKIKYTSTLARGLDYYPLTGHRLRVIKDYSKL